MTETPQKNPLIPDSWYEKLEYIARVVLPAFATLYLTVAALVGWSNGPTVAGIVIAVDTFLGIFLGLAQRSYDNSDAKFDGSVNLIPNAEGDQDVVMKVSPDVLDGLSAGDTVKLQVNELPGK